MRRFVALIWFACVENRDEEATEKFRAWLYQPDPSEVARLLKRTGDKTRVKQAPSWWDDDNDSWLITARKPKASPAADQLDGPDHAEPSDPDLG